MTQVLLPLLLLSLVYSFLPSNAQQTVEGDSPKLTVQEYEEHFRSIASDVFYRMPHAALLYIKFADRSNSSTGEKTVEKHLKPLSLVFLIQEDRAQILKSDYAQTLYQQKKHSPKVFKHLFLIFYRCFPDVTNLHDYQLKMVTIDDIYPDRSLDLLWFQQPKIDSKCQMVTLQNLDPARRAEMYEPILNPLLRDPPNPKPLTRSHFESSFPVAKQFIEKRHLTILFKSISSDTEPEPIPECLVSLLSNGKGIVHPSCARILDVQIQLNKEIGHLIMPYRCFSKDNSDEYALFNTTVDSIGRENERDMIYFEIPNNTGCQPAWKMKPKSTESSSHEEL